LSFDYALLFTFYLLFSRFVPSFLRLRYVNSFDLPCVRFHVVAFAFCFGFILLLRCAFSYSLRCVYVYACCYFARFHFRRVSLLRWVRLPRLFADVWYIAFVVTFYVYVVAFVPRCCCCVIRRYVDVVTFPLLVLLLRSFVALLLLR